MNRNNKPSIKRPKAFVGALMSVMGSIINAQANQAAAATQAAGMVEAAQLNAKASKEAQENNAALQEANTNYSISNTAAQNTINAMSQYNNMVANSNANIENIKRGNRMAYRNGGTVKRSCRKKLANGVSDIPLRGSVPMKITAGGHANYEGVASNGQPVVRFVGRNHRHGGINVDTGNAKINVENGEYGVMTNDGNLLIVPNRKIEGFDAKQAIRRGITPERVGATLAYLESNNPKYAPEYTYDSNKSNGRQKGEIGLWLSAGSNLASAGLGVHNYFSNRGLVNNAYNTIRDIYNNAKDDIRYVDTSNLADKYNSTIMPAFAALNAPRISIGSRMQNLDRERMQARRDIRRGTASSAAALDRYGLVQDKYNENVNKINETVDNEINQINAKNAELATQTNIANAQQRNTTLSKIIDATMQGELANMDAYNKIHADYYNNMANLSQWRSGQMMSLKNNLFNGLSANIGNVAKYVQDYSTAKRQNIVNLYSALANMDADARRGLGVTDEQWSSITKDALNTMGLKI